MKVLIFSIILIGSEVTFAKKQVDLESFNKAVGQNINEVLEENPQIYEVKPGGRHPASVNNRKREVPAEIENIEKLDSIDEQVNTHTSW